MIIDVVHLQRICSIVSAIFQLCWKNNEGKGKGIFAVPVPSLKVAYDKYFIPAVDNRDGGR